MSKETGIIIGSTVAGIVTTLVWGEALGRVISGPIAAWRGRRNVIDGEKLAELIDVMNQRICDLEEKIEGESK